MDDTQNYDACADKLATLCSTSNYEEPRSFPKHGSARSGYPRPGPIVPHWIVRFTVGSALLLPTVIGLSNAQPAYSAMTTEAMTTEDRAQAALSRSIRELNSNANRQFQGVWIEEIYGCGIELCRKYLASHNGHKPLPAASLTKIITSLALLDRYGPSYTFKTKIYLRQPIRNRSASDIFIVSEGDPYFGGHQVQHIVDKLKWQGIDNITGGIYYHGPFTYDFSAGAPARRSFARTLATYFLNLNYNRIGNVSWQNLFLRSPIVSYQGRSITEILKAMNSYSNNFIADTSARILGGGSKIEQTVERIAGIPPGEIHLVNGSGLPPDQDSFGLNDSEHRNLMSPKAACDALVSMKRSLRKHLMKVDRVLPIAQKDEGTLKWRNLPADALGKTGTLNDTSALAVLVPKSWTSSYCITIINVTPNVPGARVWQERLVNRIHDL